jgi:hypothetical protein
MCEWRCVLGRSRLVSRSKGVDGLQDLTMVEVPIAWFKQELAYQQLATAFKG